MLEKRVRMPYVPALSNDTDTSSFEDTFTKERPVDSGVNEGGKGAGGPGAGVGGAGGVGAAAKKSGGLMGMLGLKGKGGGAGDVGGEGKGEEVPADAFANFSFVKNNDEAH